MLKAQGYLERRLNDISTRTGTKYNVTWQDYDTGAPITAQMVAEKIDIGSMGDYPMLINGSKTQANERARTEIVSVTGYNPKGALNMVVVAPNSPAQKLTDLAGQKVSASVGSAGHGTLVRALAGAGIDPKTGVEVLNQQPQVGASALESGQVQALSQFVAWPGLLVFQGKAKLLYDGAELNYPTLHGVVVRRAYAAEHPEVLDAFLQAQLDATDFLNQKPLEAAKIVADGQRPAAGSGVSLQRPRWHIVRHDAQAVACRGAERRCAVLEVDRRFRRTRCARLRPGRPVARGVRRSKPGLRQGGGRNGEPVRARRHRPGVQRRPSTTPRGPANSGSTASDSTQAAASPTCLLKAVRDATAKGAKVRAAYVPDAELGTRWFADKSAWVRDGQNYLPFGTPAGAQRFIAAHPGSSAVDYQQALSGAV